MIINYVEDSLFGKNTTDLSDFERIFNCIDKILLNLIEIHRIAMQNNSQHANKVYRIFIMIENIMYLNQNRIDKAQYIALEEIFELYSKI